jgi:hypothetical protein
MRPSYEGCLDSSHFPSHDVIDNYFSVRRVLVRLLTNSNAATWWIMETTRIVSLFTLLLTLAHASYLAVTREPSLFEQRLVWDDIVDKYADRATFHRPLLRAELDEAPVVIVDVGPQGTHIKNDHRSRWGSMVTSHSLTLSLSHFCQGSQIGGFLWQYGWSADAHLDHLVAMEQRPRT